MQWMALGAALGSAVGFAVNTSCQHYGVARTDTGRGPHWWARLATRPVWLVGSAAGLFAVALQALALATGPVTIVQPVLTTELVFALAATALLQRSRPACVEWCWAGVLLAALAVFLLAAHPASGPPRQISHTVLLVTTLAGLALAAGLAGLATRPAARYRAALLGASTGVGFGVTSVLGKYCLLQLLHDGPLPALADWPAWTLLVVALASVAVEQTAFHAGPLAASLPPLTVLEPLVSTTGGVIALNETLRLAPGSLFFEALSGLLLLTAAIQLARHTAPTRQPQRQHTTPSHNHSR